MIMKRVLYPNKPMLIYDIERFLESIDPKDWIVQPKWDGHRALISCDSQGKIRILSRQLTPLTLAAKGNWGWVSMLPLPRPWVLDGELTLEGEIIIWDYAEMAGQDSLDTPYNDRLEFLAARLRKPFRKGSHSIALIQTYPVQQYKKIVKPGIEGLVFKRRSARDFWNARRTNEVPSQLKWKARISREVK